MNKKPLRERSALIYVLVALIPYSKPNMLLSYKPSRFYAELEKISNYKESTLKDAYSRGVRTGYIDYQANIPRLTKLGQRKIAPFVAKKFGKDAKLMVIFDIPEADRVKRGVLRRFLRSWGFKQIQKSVWQSEYDYRDELIALVADLELGECVEVYESARVV